MTDGGFTPGWAIAIQGAIYIITQLIAYLRGRFKSKQDKADIIGGTAAQTTVDEVKLIATQARDEARLANAILIANGMALPRQEERGPG